MTSAISQVDRSRSDDLYNHILCLLRQNHPAMALDECFELVTIDYDRERAWGALGLIYLALEQYEKSIEILEKCRRDFGESGPTLTNLSKAHHSLGRRQEALALATRAMHADPNQCAGLMWYATLRKEQDGADIDVVFEELSQEPNSWRALLWIARESLTLGRLDEAEDLYSKALSMGCDSDALLMIGGDLGLHGHPDSAIRFVAPRYDPQRHDPNVGVNLLQAYLDAGRWPEGRRLLERIDKKALGDLWMWYEQRFWGMQKSN